MRAKALDGRQDTPIWRGMEDTTRVLYNETCPVCRFEIDAYRKRSEKDGLPIAYDSLQAAQDWGLTSDQAARRLHVRKDGAVLSGMPAFRALWAQMPHMAWLARVTGWPVVRPVCVWAYDRVMAPLLYRAHLRRQARAKPPVQG